MLAPSRLTFWFGRSACTPAVTTTSPCANPLATCTVDAPASPTPISRSDTVLVVASTIHTAALPLLRTSAVGRVREVAPRADPVTGTFAVRVRLIDPPPAMRLGTTVTGRLRLEGAAAIQLPATALLRADGKTAVWVFDKASGTVSLRHVELRQADASTVQVVAGLQPGDVVVTAGVQALRPGQKVRLLETQS